MIRLITTLTVFIFLGLNAIAQTSVSLGYNSFFGNRGKVNVGNVVTRVNDSQLVVLYENSNNFQSGAFQVADYSGNTISSYGSTTYLGAVSGRRCINLEDNIMVICYNTAPGRVLNFRVGTASGTGSSAAMSMGNTLTSTYNANQFEFVPLTETTFLIAWEANSSNSEGYVAVGSISGTGSSASVSLGTPVLFEKQYAHNISIDTLSSEKFVVAYSDSDKDNGESIIGTVSNTTITIDNLKESGFYLADEVIDVNVMAISANQFVVSYSPTNTSTESGQAKVGTVSGNGITWSSAADTFETNLSYNQQVFGVAMDHNEVVLSYVLNGKGYISVGKVSGSGTGASILFSSGIKYTDWFYNENKITRLSETQLAVAYTFNNSSSISGQKTYGLYPGAIKIGSGAFAGFDYPEIAVLGNSNEIDNEDSSPSSTNHTHFGETPISGGTVSRTFTIENTGIGPLELTGAPYVEISGTNASDFTVSTQPSASIVSVSGSATFVVTFDPSTTGSRTATVSISSDDDDESTYTFDIEG
ncbi:MAG: choice-of-anchor D domain-containing protein, partial [Bacteroidia bacterium]